MAAHWLRDFGPALCPFRAKQTSRRPWVRFGPLKRACAGVPRDVGSAPGAALPLIARMPAVERRAPARCPLAISWQPLRVRASRGVSRQADDA